MADDEDDAGAAAMEDRSGSATRDGSSAGAGCGSDDGVAEDGTDADRAIASLHRPGRGVVPADRPMTPVEAFPGCSFTLQTPYPRAARVDLGALKRPFLALEFALTIWSDHHHNLAFRSHGSVTMAVDTARCFEQFLDEEDEEGRIQCMMDLAEVDIDHFDLWAHGSWPQGSSVPHARLRSLRSLLRGAERYGLTSPAIGNRLGYISRFHEPPRTIARDAYSPFVMGQIRQGARSAVRRAVLRMSNARKLKASTATSADEKTLLFMRDVNFIADDKNFTRVLQRAGHESLRELQDQIYPGLPDLTAFAILIADDCGLPPECVKELSEDCLKVFDGKVGLGRLSYVKRRRDPIDADFTEVVKTKVRWSTGWLVALLLAITATARRQMARNHHAGRLFIGRVGSSLKHIDLNQAAMRAHLDRFPVEDDDGEPLDGILLSRIRKTNKADRYTRAGGDLHRIGKDHTRRAFARNYAMIGALQGTHDRAVEAGLRDGLRDALLATRVAADDTAEAAVEPGSADLWMARCLDFAGSPYQREGARGCGAPFWGCLDCRNAVVTRSKLPNLLRLLGHLRDKRQEMGLDEFQRGFGFAFVRLQQILAKFDPADVRAALAENADFGDAQWSLAQLAYVV